MPSSSLPIAIYYEQPNWFKPLFAELDRRGTSYVKLHAPEHTFAPEDHPEQEYALVFNRMSPSAWNRDHGDQIFYTLGFLDHLERRGVRVINGLKAFRTELSKAAQLSLLEDLGLPYPKARVIHRAAQATSVTEGLRWPVVVKPNIGGSGAGVKRFDQPTQLAAQPRSPPARRTASLSAWTRPRWCRSSFPPRDAHIVRVEVLERPIPLRDQGPHHRRDLRPVPGGHLPHHQRRGTEPRGVRRSTRRRAACASKAYEPPREVIADVERIMQHAGIEIGGVEYITDDRDGQRLYYDINALSNFVADGVNVIGFDPFAKLADWLEAEAAKARACPS